VQAGARRQVRTGKAWEGLTLWDDKGMRKGLPA
jgi:hypothetical protein